jgi:hypothetical protein
LKGGYHVESNNKANGTAIILIAFSILTSIAGAFSLTHLLPLLNRWQIAGYAIVAGIFIAVTAVILTQILRFFAAE